MKKLFKQIAENNKILEVIQEVEQATRESKFYDHFSNEADREKDIRGCLKERKVALNNRQALLDNLQLEINKELNRVSQAQKALTLDKHLN